MTRSDNIRLSRKYFRAIEESLRRDKRTLFLALEEFANIGPNRQSWKQFRSRWPKFFPPEEYDKAVEGIEPSVYDYPHFLGLLWARAEDDPYLKILLGIEAALLPEDLLPEDIRGASLSSISARLYVEWDEGAFRYESSCDFQRALYLLFKESWRARICEKCEARFIAKRAAQKYCSTDCSESVQRELKLRWWNNQGKSRRLHSKASVSRRKENLNGDHKAR